LKKGALYFFLLLNTCLIAQEQAWVFFKEKPNSSTRIASPKDFLSEKSILRKQKYNIIIDSKDLPIEIDYINRIKSQLDINYLAMSKWFNACYVEGEITDIEALLDLDIIEDIYFMNKELNSSTSEKKIHLSENLENNKIEITSISPYGQTEIQTTQIKLNSLHNTNFTGEGITIAIMDNGFSNVDSINAFDRAREKKLLHNGYDFEDKTNNIYAYTGGSHGTTVLSTMLGFIEDSFIGTAIDAQYYLFRTEVDTSESPKEEAYWIAAAEMADSLGVDIINTSLGYSTFDDPKYNYTTADMDGKTTFISRAATIALQKGMLTINSAGNSGNNTWKIINAPADSPDVLSVGAIDTNGSLASFSSIGPTADGRIKPDIVALGSPSVIINETGNISSASGTSFSSPIIAGATACFWQSMPNKTAKQIMDLIKLSSSLANNPNNNLGYGIPNFEFYLNTENNLEKTLKLITNPIDELLIFEFPNNWSSQKYTIYNISGKIEMVGSLNINATIDVSQLSQGIYFLNTYTNSNLIKFVKL